MSNSLTVWRGPSAITGAPIRVVVTLRSTNRKTGDMAQVWILADDARPTDALASGADDAICGACPLAGTAVDGRRVGRACYVNVGQGPQSVYRATGDDPTVTDPHTVGAMLAGRAVRLGAYGDPAAAPLWVMRALVASARLHTGYTHQWRTCDPEWRTLLMASADSADDALEAWSRGWRTYRVAPVGTADQRMPREIACPSDRGVECKDCGACGGTNNGTREGRVSIVIEAHGTGKAYV